MQPEITVAIIAATVSALGWIVNYIASSIAERRRLQTSSRLSYVEEQLKVLYGPLAFLVIEGRRSFNDLLAKLGRTYVFNDGSNIDGDDLKLWLFWVDNEFMPRNSRIKDLLAANAHLISGGKLPQSYINFLDHHNSWQIEHVRWRQEGALYSWHSKVSWPTAFEDEVISTFEDLMKEHALLIGIVGGNSKPQRRTR